MDFPINLAVSLEKSFPKQPAEKLECHATLPPPGKPLQMSGELCWDIACNVGFGAPKVHQGLMENHRLKSVPRVVIPGYVRSLEAKQFIPIFFKRFDGVKLTGEEGRLGDFF